jgi:hypothetical protein
VQIGIVNFAAIGDKNCMISIYHKFKAHQNYISTNPQFQKERYPIEYIYFPYLYQMLAQNPPSSSRELEKSSGKERDENGYRSMNKR